MSKLNFKFNTQMLYMVFCVFLVHTSWGQNTPVFPITCPSGSSIYTIDHEDLTRGSLPGGFCVETEISGLLSGSQSTANYTVLNGAFVNTPDFIAAGGALTFIATNDGDDADLKYTFCQNVTNPYIIIGPTGPEIGTVYSVFELDGTTEINVNYIDGQNGFIVQNGNEITTTINNRSGYVQIQDNVSRAGFIINITNESPGGADGFDIGVGVCMPDPPTADPQCPFDLYQWEKAGTVQSLLRDANGVYFEKDDPSSAGDALFAGTPLCGAICLVEAGFLSCDAPPTVAIPVCPLEVYEVTPRCPDTDGFVTTRYWTPSTSPAACCFTTNGGIPQDPIFEPFDGTDNNGLPQHQNGATTNQVLLEELGVEDENIPGDVSGNMPNSNEQAIQDAWLLVPEGISSFEIRLGGPRDEAAAFYMGAGVASLNLVGTTLNSTETWCVNVPCDASTTACGHSVVRVRLYHHDSGNRSNSQVQWNIGNGFEEVPRKWLQSISDPDTDSDKPTTDSPDPDGAYLAVQDANGNWFSYADAPTTMPFSNTPLIEVSTCNDLVAICGIGIGVCMPDADPQCPFDLYQWERAGTVQSLLRDANGVFFEKDDPSSAGDALFAGTPPCGEICLVEAGFLPCDAPPTVAIPVCPLEVYEVTPRCPDTDGFVTTRYWTPSTSPAACCFTTNGGIPQGPIFEPFDGTDNNGLPQHQNGATTNQVLLEELGVEDENIPGDVSGNMPNSNEQAIQDAWLLVPEGISSFEIRLGGPRDEAAAFYMGAGVASLNLVGTTLNNTETWCVNVPCDASTTACGHSVVRVRLYHHDSGNRSNSQVQWNIGNGFEEVPRKWLQSISDPDTDSDKPTTDSPDPDGAYLAVQDANGNWFSYADAPTTMPFSNTPLIEVSACNDLVAICGTDLQPMLDTRGVCGACCMLEVSCPPPSLGTITCNDDIPAATDEASFEALGGDIADDPGPCGDLVITHMDVFNPPTDICNGRTLTRTYTISDDNSTFTCTQTLTISAPVAPMITAFPADEDVVCSMDIADSEGDIDYMTDCGQDATVSVGAITPADSNSDCGESNGDQYTITYTVTDDCDRTDTYTQTFTIDNPNPGPTITAFPADEDVVCSADIESSEDEIDFTTTCMVNAVVSVGPITPADGNSDCGETNGDQYTITYTVTDDCDRTDTHTQTFTIVNPDPGPTIAVVHNLTVDCFEAINPNPAWAEVTTTCNVTFEVEVDLIDTNNKVDNCPDKTYTYEYTVTDACGRTATDEQIYTIVNEGPSLECPDNCEVFSCYDGDYEAVIAAWLNTVTATSSCSDELVVNNNYLGDPGTCITNGITEVRFWATDDCVRTAECESLIIIIDDDAPAITQPPHDLLIPCTANTEDIYNAWIANHGGADAVDACGGPVSWQAIPNQALNCDAGPQAIEVDFVATDDCNNSVTVTATFNTKLLPLSVNVAGLIQTEAAEAVSAVEVAAYQSSGMTAMDMSDNSGDYSFEELPFEENTEIVPSRDGDWLNGVSTYDLIVMQQHILGAQFLDSPYKMIAADANRSGTVSTLDLVVLRRLILHIDEELSDNTSWRFVDADFVFPNPQDPFETEFPEAYSLSGEEEELADFVAVKIGDLNLDSESNPFQTGADDRSGLDELKLQLETPSIEGGSQRVNITSTNFEGINGFQFTLELDPTAGEILAIESDVLPEFSAANYNLERTESGIVTVSWHNSTPVSISQEETLFSLILRAPSATSLDDAIAINSRLTRAEAYQGSSLLNLSLQTGTVLAKDFKLFQNQPNPFEGSTVISFNLPEATEAMLTIYDVSGKQVYQRIGDFAAGYNQVEVLRSELSTGGVLYYQLSTSTDTQSRKMILLD